MIDGYVTRGIVISKDRLYCRPKSGGLGLIDLNQYITALQCSWIRRCHTVLNDSWRWRIADAFNFNFNNPQPATLDPELYPIENNILNSFKTFSTSYYLLNENFLQANIVNNSMFLRENPGRANGAREYVDENFFGHQFYATHKERLQNLKMCDLVRDGRVLQYNPLVASTAVPFTQVMYFRLLTVGNYALLRYANKTNSNGTSLPMKDFVCRTKKGSKRFRMVLAKVKVSVEVDKLRVVQTFFRLIPADVPDPVTVGKLHCIWTWHFLSNRMRFFAFQYFNNSLGTKARIAARYRNDGNNIDQRCTFCVKSGSRVPMREDFIHVFYDCPYINPLVNRAFEVYFRLRLDETQKKLCYMTGSVATYQKNDSFFYLLTAILINYTVWQWKLKNMVPSIATLTNEVDYFFNLICFTSKKIENMAIASNCLICRRWRNGDHGRG
jgi:hypothetical protein